MVQDDTGSARISRVSRTQSWRSATGRISRPSVVQADGGRRARRSGAGTLLVMLTQAARAALQMIANERVLHDETLLDAIGRPIRIRKSAVQDTANLAELGRMVLSALPADLAAGFGTPDEEDSVDKFVLVNPDSRVAVSLAEYSGPDGGAWVTAAVAALMAVDDAAAQTAAGAVSVDELLNLLNSGSDACAWLAVKSDEGSLLGRVSGAASPMDDRLTSWRDVVAHLTVEALAAVELFDRTPGAPTPAGNYLKLLSLEHGSVSAFTAEDLRRAAAAFRSGLSEDLARVVDVRPTETGVLLTVPFRAGTTTHPISIFFAPVNLDPDNGFDTAGLVYLSRCYASVPAGSALRWAGIFNGGEDNPDDDEVWDQTTPWLSGNWRVIDGDGEDRIVMHRGFVPNALREHVNLTELVAGVVREVWVSCDKYRLRARFNDTVGVPDGTVR